MSRRLALVLLRALVLVGLILALVPFAALAANDTADTAQGLDAAHSTVVDNDVGTPGGTYRYFSFQYQGADAPVLVTLKFQPGYPATGRQAFGFNLYGNNGLTFAGQPQDTSNDNSYAQYTFANPAAMTVLIQLYNYTNGMQVGYTLTVNGLTGGSTASVVGQTNTTPDQAASVGAINAQLAGTIVGTSAGAFHYYTLHYPGGNTPMTVTMNASPSYTGSSQAYGINLYRVGANAPSGPVGSGVVTSADTNSETITCTIAARSAGTYQLQVFNYWPNVGVTYAINVTGLAGTVLQASGNTDSGHAILLNSAQPGAMESLAGSGAGAFNYFLVNYPGNNSTLNLGITFSDLGGAPDSALGFNVYNGSTLQGTAHVQDDGTGVHSGVFTYSNADATTFGIQVFNYASGTTASYTLQQIGSQ
jgi:hypothetical protein